MIDTRGLARLWLAAAVTGMLAWVPATSQAALLGLIPAEPTVDFDSSGILDYNAATGTVTISGTPSTLFRTDPFLLGIINGATADDEKLISIQFKVDTVGNFVSGVTGADLTVKGSIDIDGDGVIDIDGVLLQAEVTQFGFQDGGPGGTDTFDVRFGTVTGLLAGYYVGSDLALNVVSENSTEYTTPFSGSWTTDFTAAAKGVLGQVAPLQPPLCKLHVDGYCSVNGSPNASKCRIKVVKAPHHWDFEDRSDHGTPYKAYTYGLHGDVLPNWAKRTPGTNVTFNYVVTNTGTTPVSALQVQDSFDSALAGVPAGLNPGQSVTLTRTVNLYEGLEDEVLATGAYQTAHCGDKDEVVVKDLLRDRRRHDYDNFRDKGKDDNQAFK